MDWKLNLAMEELAFPPVSGLPAWLILNTLATISALV